MTTNKHCTCCGHTKPIEEFRVRPNSQHRDSWCRQCHREANVISMRRARQRQREIKLAEARVRRIIDDLVAAVAALKELRK